MNYRTLSDLARLCRSNLHRIPKVDVIAGIPRSGMIVASQLATLTNQPLVDAHELIRKTWEHTLHGVWSAATDVRSILLVDDSVSGGQTMARVLAQLQPAYPDAKIVTLAAIRKLPLPHIDITFEEVPPPHIFEWCWYRHIHTRRVVLDMDGVICTETVPGEREKGLPLFLPTRRVKAIATGRDESERAVTEAWLAKYNVRYERLCMTLPGSSGRKTKARAALEVGARWIVESDIHQAEWLHARTKLPVLCTDANRMLT